MYNTVTIADFSFASAFRIYVDGTHRIPPALRESLSYLASVLQFLVSKCPKTTRLHYRMFAMCLAPQLSAQ
eukprot:786493-Pleurochrysis_carterae.AAC.1